MREAGDFDVRPERLLDVEHLGHQQGHRVLRISRKGGRDALEPLSAPVERSLDAYLGDRASGPLFLDDQGAADV